ncbi:MAG: pyridoxal phosphate-dependent aminotransferase [Bacteroidota bacterium]|nr:pyridoxal phosphate-dependent aminotransferase [Bacteroidota bacterium]
MKKNTPINAQVVSEKIKANNIIDFDKATIRQIKKLVDDIQNETGDKFIRMEMGIPGLKPNKIGIEAEIKALKEGIPAIYPDIYGTRDLKNEISRFCKLFLNIEVNPEGCIPTVGSMQGSFASFMTINRIDPKKNTTLFIDPGFPVHKQQHHVLGIPYETFDVYNYRGEKLHKKLESYLRKGNISCLIYSNPNNPSWICFTDRELKIIGELANKYGVIVIEDLAYFGMDFRQHYTIPGESPYQPSVTKYTDNFVLLISSSKVFSYAGQRIGMMVISDKVYNIKSENLLKNYIFDTFGKAMIFGSIYSLSSGTAHTPQYALAAILKAVNNGEYDFRKDMMEYGEKAKIMKKIFLDNGFSIVYDMDEDNPIADGFYFTFSYPGFQGNELLKELIYYGISAITLKITGSERTEGIRACTSLISRDQFPDLEYRLKKFREDHPVGG